MQSKTTSLLLGIALGLSSAAQADTNEPLPTGKVETPFGEIAIEQGLPATPAEVQKLFDQLDFQQATQSYLWALPIVAFAEWQEVQEKVFGATDHDLVLYSTYADRLGILTGNATTPYLMNFFDLGRSGPIVIQLPPGPVAGGLSDFWQREMGAVGELGADKGKGGKFIVIAPGKRVPAGARGYRVLHATTVNFFFGLRALDPDPKKEVYPYSQRAHPPATRLVSPEGKQWYGGQPRGMDYWKRLHAILQVEPVAERDRFYMAMLANLGIEKGKPFAPDERQAKILGDAAVVGDLMAQSNSFAKRFPSARHWPDRRWAYVLDMSDSSQRARNYDELMERTAYFYEAVTYSNAMITKTPGAGQAYLGAYTEAYFDKSWKLDDIELID